MRGSPEEVADDESRKNPYSISAAHVLFQRVMIRTGAAFESFKHWLRAAKLSGADVPGGSIGPRVSRQLTAVMAAKERDTTTKVVEASSLLGLAQDARQAKVPALGRAVMWAWPRGLPRSPELHCPKMVVRHGLLNEFWLFLVVARRNRPIRVEQFLMVFPYGPFIVIL